MSFMFKSVAALGVTGLLAVPAAAQTKWDMPVPYNESNFHTQNILQFAKELSAATGGKLTIQVHPSGSLFKHPEIKPSVRRGLAPIGEILASLASNESPIYGVDSVPFLTGGYDDAKKLYAAQKPFLEKKLDSEGLMLLYSVPWPPQGLYAKKEIKSVEDISGLKFRTYNAATSRLAQLIKAVPDAGRGAGYSDGLPDGPRRSDGHVAGDRRRQQGLGLPLALSRSQGLAAPQHRVREQGSVRQAAG